MRKLLVSAIVAGATLIGAAGSASAGEVSFGLSIGVPPPWPVYVAPPAYYYPPAYAAPPVVVVPGPRYVYEPYPVYYSRWHKRHWHHED